MQNLLNELTSGTTSYNEKGEMVTHPPTAVMLRAARTLKQLLEQHETNMMAIHSMTNELNQYKEAASQPKE